jgi:hypothetical protein
MTTAAPSPSLSSTPTVDETARRAFESAWRQGHPEPIERFLPSPDHPAFLPTLEELVHIDLEFAWKASDTDHATSGSDDNRSTIAPPSRPVVESYLERFPQLKQPEIVLRLLQQEYLVRHRYGDEPTSNAFRSSSRAAARSSPR